MMSAPSAAAAQRSPEADSPSSEETLPDLIDVRAPRLRSNAGLVARTVPVREAPEVRLDRILADVPGLRLFRRADSLTANPTIQGLTLRGVGANAAGRVLVTLDGVPLNDPFGGWIYWSSLPAEALESATVYSGGGLGAFGAQALAGAVELTSRGQVNGIEARLMGGSFDTGRLGIVAGASDDRTDLTVSASLFESDGPFIIAEEDRGSADARAASEARHLAGTLRHALPSGAALTVAVRWFDEQRVNGSDPAVNDSEGFDGSVSLSGPIGDWEVTGLVYGRDRGFQNVFAAFREERTVARPVLDQFDVPAWELGGAVTAERDGLELGLDVRRMSGTVSERFRNLGAGFTRQRDAGGDQIIAGAYFDYQGAMGEDGRIAVSLSGRLDRWRSFSGFREERDLADGALLREDPIDVQSGWQPSGRLGLTYSMSETVELRGAAFRSWRLPTINEFYRPFRVGNDITEANPALTPEGLWGIEIGAAATLSETTRLSATLFRQWLNDAVGNVTIAFGPGFFPLGGFVPAGGVLRQRANIDRQIIDGIEARIEQDAGALSFALDYLYARARVTAFAAQPDLVGLRPVQTPRHSLTGTATYVTGPLQTCVSERYASNIFDDDLNERRLGDLATVDLDLRYAVSADVAAFFTVENLLDATVVSAISATGLRTLARPQTLRVGLDIRL